MIRWEWKEEEMILSYFPYPAFILLVQTEKSC
jgi:hypothetical protein